MSNHEPVIHWSLGIPHSATVAARDGGYWELSVRHARAASRWSWKVSHSHDKRCDCGMTSTAQFALLNAERAMKELDQAP
ncbi:hypothetical protein ABVV53_13865 [Novosphingobium sp. RD2P27]|uniref:DUF1508 domain-containing protein n=1 Tax=Novosphingobium kalidii TaxID=3230299 RepID=A0ABV2D3S1_9SPHN